MELSSDKFIKPAKLQTAVLFMVFNRPDTTELVFDKIRQAKPPRLYIAADGPRGEHEDEEEKVAKVREIATRINWPCEVKTLFREKNLGCKKAVSESITWFFEHEEQGIILEDDCLPHLNFFTFCETLLDRYAEDTKVSVITGNNFQNGCWRGDASYYYSKYTMCWGWATWRRTWQHYQGDLTFWPNWRRSNSWLKQTPNKNERRYWERLFEKIRAGQIDTWDIPWIASVWYYGGLTATPNMNLVSNIGFREDATHTISKNSKFSKMPVKNLGMLKHPRIVERNVEADIWTFDYHYGGKNLRFPYSWIIFPSRVIGYIYRKLKSIL